VAGGIPIMSNKLNLPDDFLRNVTAFLNTPPPQKRKKATPHKKGKGKK
jgi:hypothetical protein